TGALRDAAGPALFAPGPDLRRRGADEHEPRPPHGPPARGVLGEGARAPAPRAPAPRAGRPHPRPPPPVAPPRFRPPAPARLVAHTRVERATIGVRVDGDRADPHLVQRGGDAAGDLAAVGDQDLLEHGRRSSMTRCCCRKNLQRGAAARVTGPSRACASRRTRRGRPSPPRRSARGPGSRAATRGTPPSPTRSSGPAAP